jgi:hypothetical protein
LAPKAIHEHATDRQREHVARHGHVGARTAPEFVSAPAGQWAPTRPPNASTRAKKAAVKKATAKRTAAKQAPATRAATKKAVAKKAVAKKSAIKKVAAPKKSAAAKKATKRPRG